MKDRENTETIQSDTFTPTGKHLGMGCWGRVDEYKDLSGQKWAIKVFVVPTNEELQMVRNAKSVLKE